MIRRSDYCDGDNCSVAQIKDGHCYVYGKKIYYISNPRIDYVDDKMVFYYHDVERESLNQAPEAISERQEVYFKLNTGHEILKAFEDIEHENRDKVADL